MYFTGILYNLAFVLCILSFLCFSFRKAILLQHKQRSVNCFDNGNWVVNEQQKREHSTAWRSGVGYCRECVTQ
jgi:hypothetical protein